MYSDSESEVDYKRNRAERPSSSAAKKAAAFRTSGRATSRVEGALQTKLYINGRFVDSVSRKTFAVYNPATGEEICQVAEADKADVDLAVRAARDCFENTWKFTDGSARRDLMLKLADLIEKNKEELATLESLDNGKPFSESNNVDLVLVIKCLRYYAGWADKISGKTNPVDGPFFSFTKHEPVGVIGQIIPWNFPLLMAAWKLGPALAMGCTIVLKPAEQTPLSALRLAELIHEAGYPAGCVNVVPGFGPTAGAAIASHKDIDKCAFTGSTEVGKIIMETAAKSNLKRVSLELGGKSPLIINEDADIDAAINAAHVGVFFNQGQVCTASSRIFVHERIHEEFVRKLVDRSRGRTQGNPFKDVQMGPQVSEEQQNTVWKYIKIGKKEGANCVLGGKRVEESGYFIQPTIFTNVTDDMTIAREEIFGPVMSILKFRTLDEAIERSNNSNYGLAAGIFTKDLNTALKYANRVKAGTVWVNTYHSFDTAQPFGGYKMSGTGRELGEYALQLYTEPKTVMIKLNDAPVKN
jgi:aldehyde dehydrogenase (NAD+)